MNTIPARFLGLRRPRLSPFGLSLIGAALLMALYNGTYWSKVVEVFAGHPVQMVLFQMSIYGLTVAFLSLFAWRPVVRPALALVLILCAVTSYYVDTLGVVVDRDMIQNVATTTFNESRHLLTPSFVTHVLLWGALPALALFIVRVPRRSWAMTLGTPVLLFVLGLGVGLGLLLTNYGAYASILRERKDMMAAYQPGAPLVGAVRYAKMMLRSGNVVVQPVGTDARKTIPASPDRKPVVLILVAGETARARDFGLNGYDRDTTPKLAARTITNFTNVHSCGTATAVSLPCMFSPFTRAEYSYAKGIGNEDLLDVLVHAGFTVEWWDNNTGHKGIAARLPTRSLSVGSDPVLCRAGECTDGIFKQALADYLPTVTQDTVVVLHQIGSHGPAYFLRYPEGFGRFQPACETAEFGDCTQEEIVNAYDNTIAYTDHVLAETIDLLAGQTGFDTALFYVSDHGESLGEGGLFLHGAPYFAAPEDQTRVPMILWMSDGFVAAEGIDRACLSGRSDDALSHDNLFHSILGLLAVETVARDASLDLFDGCRTPPG